MQNSDFWIRITSLYVSQTWLVILCMYKSVLSIRITSLYDSQPSSVVFPCKTATVGPELQVSMGTRPHLSICACKSATLGLEIKVSVGPRPHMWFMHLKRWLLDQNNKSLWVQDMTCRFVHVQERALHRLTSHYGSQHSSVGFACKTAPFGTELQVSVCTRPHLSFCACKSAWLAPEILVSIGSSPHLWFLLAKQRVLYPNNESLWDPDLTCHFVFANQRD